MRKHMDFACTEREMAWLGMARHAKQNKNALIEDEKKELNKNKSKRVQNAGGVLVEIN